MRLESAYNNRLAVPSYVDYLARWKKLSEEVAQRPDMQFSQHASLSPATFAPQEVSLALTPQQWGSDRCHVTHFKALGTSPRPLLVYIHGGYWRAMGPEYFYFLAPLWNSHGVDLALIGYDIDNSVGVDQIAAQCRAGLRWLYSNADRLGVDPQRIVVSGHSAGGHLAAMAASEETPQNAAAPTSALARPFSVDGSAGAEEPLASLSWLAGCVCLSGVFNLAPLVETSMQEGLRLTDAVIGRASPVHRRPHPEILRDQRLALFFGREEIAGFHEQHAALIKAWKLEGRAVTEALAGIHHFSIVDTLVEPESKVFQTITRMLEVDR
jgi:arylformamidase